MSICALCLLAGCVTADSSLPGITGVSSIGFMDADGAKLSAIVVAYNTELSGAAVSAEDYEIDVFQPAWNDSCVNYGAGSIGDIVSVYVNDEADVSEEGDSGKGRFVIIEVYTDYLLSSEQSFTSTMSVAVRQVRDINAAGKVIPASAAAVTNYEDVQSYNSYHDIWTTVRSPLYGTYTIRGVEGFRYFTDSEEYGTPDGEPFRAEHCFNEQDGLYYDISLSYALYVPEDYDPSGSYALVTIENPAANEGTHPFVSVTQTRSPAVMASAWAADQVRDNFGLDGIIVVVPTVTQRVNDNACTPAQYEALVRLWDYLIAEYAINTDHVYGIGQSVGGMVLMETNRNRDNFFAGIMMYENQWAQNYYKDTLFARGMLSSEAAAATAPMHYPRTDSYITWDYYYDEKGEKVYEGHDPYNYYYLISDDNVLVMNLRSNNLSNNTWQELSYLYSDLTGYEIPRLIVDSTAPVEEQNAAIREYLSSRPDYNGTEMGLGWISFENGSNGFSARKVDAGYEWLLSQTRSTELSRPKLDINRPFELAEVQITDGTRLMAGFTDAAGNPVYYRTAKAGTGTQFYNTCWLNMATVLDAIPGWLPEGMSWNEGVAGAYIESVTPISGPDGRLTAVAVGYSEDMSGAVIRLKGDEIIGLDGTVRDDIRIVLDPYDLYDEDGNKIECSITNVYISQKPQLSATAERGTGSGCYVIVVLDTDSQASAVSLVQRTTIRTDRVIANATSKVYSSEE